MNESEIDVLKLHVCCYSDAEVERILDEVRREAAEKAWDEGFKQGGPMHDVNYDDPDSHRRNPYRKEDQ